MAGVVDLVVADDPEAAADAIAPHYAYQRWTYQRAHGAPGADPPPPPDPAGVRSSMRNLSGPALAVCTPEEAVAELARRLDGLPVRHVYFWASVAGMPDSLAERHVELLCTRVWPLLGSVRAAPPGTAAVVDGRPED
jgi:hypothetical protein